ncbi:MAG: TerC/Alx family metal homeostasis membrane protein [Planctomycetota bacterium]
MTDAASVFPPTDYWPLLAAFLAGVVALLALDLLVIERLAHGRPGTGGHSSGSSAKSFRISVLWTLICVGAAVGTAFAFRSFALTQLSADPTLLEGTRYAELAPAAAASTLFWEFLTGYVVELSLSVDNLFVFLVIFRYFSLDHDRQHRVLFYGIVGAIVFRAIFIGVGIELVRFGWVLFVMGLFLVFTGIKVITSEDKKLEPEKNPLIRLMSRFVPISPKFDGVRFFTRIDGRRYATPLFLALLVVESTDVAFAIDSVPAVLSISQEPFVAFGSNICAILGLRAMFFVVADAMQRFHLLKYGLGLVLVWVGLKMTALPYLFDGHVPIKLSLGVIIGLIGGTLLLSLVVKPKPEPSEAAGEESPRD